MKKQLYINRIGNNFLVVKKLNTELINDRDENIYIVVKDNSCLNYGLGDVIIVKSEAKLFFINDNLNNLLEENINLKHETFSLLSETICAHLKKIEHIFKCESEQICFIEIQDVLATIDLIHN